MTSIDYPTAQLSSLEGLTGSYPMPRSGRPFPAVVGLQGKRLATFSTQIGPFDIEDVLGHDPRSRNRKILQSRDASTHHLYEHVQRRTSEERVRNMINYYEQRVFRGYPIAGAVPAISIAVEQPVSFQRHANHPFLCEMFLETGRHNRRIVLDGLGRITGAIDLVDLVRGNKLENSASELLQKYLEGFSLPVVFFAPQLGQTPFSQDEMEQIFCDFNFRGLPVSPKDAMALDHSDPYVELTRYLDDHSKAIKEFGGMEVKRASLGSKSKGIVVQPVLLRFVRGAIEGEVYLEAARNASVEQPNFGSEHAERIRASLVEFLDCLADSMGERWADRASMHLSSPGWQVIGLLYHDMAFRLGKGSGDLKKFAVALSKLDWKRDGELFASFMTSKVSKDGANQLALNSAGASVRRELLKKMRTQLGLTELLSSSAR